MSISRNVACILISILVHGFFCDRQSIAADQQALVAPCDWSFPTSWQLLLYGQAGAEIRPATGICVLHKTGERLEGELEYPRGHGEAIKGAAKGILEKDRFALSFFHPGGPLSLSGILDYRSASIKGAVSQEGRPHGSFVMNTCLSPQADRNFPSYWTMTIEAKPVSVFLEKIGDHVEGRSMQQSASELLLGGIRGSLKSNKLDATWIDQRGSHTLSGVWEPHSGSIVGQVFGVQAEPIPLNLTVVPNQAASKTH